MSIKLDWLDRLEEKLKTIELDMNMDIWTKYREAGLAIIEVYNAEYGDRETIRLKIENRMNYKKDTFYTMVQLGRMSQEDFDAKKAKYKSLYRFTHKSKLEKEAKLVQFSVKETKFGSQEEAEQFFQQYKGYLIDKRMCYFGVINSFKVAEAKRGLI